MINIELWNKARKEQGITLEALAQKTDISISTIKDIFRGKTNAPRIDTVQTIEEALGLSTPPLQWTEEDKALGVGNHPTYLSEKEWRILNAFNDLERSRGEVFADKMIKMIEDISELPEKK